MYWHVKYQKNEKLAGDHRLHLRPFASKKSIFSDYTLRQPHIPSPSEHAVLEAYGELSSLYRAIFSLCEGGIDLSSSPCGCPPCNTPTRFMARSWNPRTYQYAHMNRNRSVHYARHLNDRKSRRRMRWSRPFQYSSQEDAVLPGARRGRKTRHG